MTINPGDKLFNGFVEVEVKFLFENPTTNSTQILAFVPALGGLRSYGAKELTTEPAMFICLNDAGDIVAEVNALERADSLDNAAMVIKLTKVDGSFKTETVHERPIKAEVLIDEPKGIEAVTKTKKGKK